jgi:hypothetical protein
VIGPPDREPTEFRREPVVLDDEHYVDAYVGYRAWWPHVCRGFVTLGSTTYETTWPKDQPLKGRCGRTWDPTPHPIASYGCKCGVHAFGSVQSLYWKFNSVTHILGEVHLFGRVQVHTAGFRAELAKVASIFRPDRRIAAFRSEHDVQRMTTLAELACQAYDVPMIAATEDLAEDLHKLQLRRLEVHRAPGAPVTAPKLGDWLQPWRPV